MAALGELWWAQVQGRSARQRVEPDHRKHYRHYAPPRRYEEHRYDHHHGY